MTDKKIGLSACIDKVGKDFYETHEETSCFAWGDTDKGLFCFLGISLQNRKATCKISANLNEWDVYAICYVKDDEVIIDKYKLPINN